MRQFPPFSLERLLKTVFSVTGDERMAILVDSPNPIARDVFFQGLQNLGFQNVGFHRYPETGGSNLDLPSTLEQDVYPHYDIILCISRYSATAPLTAAAKQFGFRGATLHGVNDIILQTGLAVDYHQVSRDAEKLRQAMTNADGFSIHFEVNAQTYELQIDCGRQEAQKSHGLCPPGRPDIANLPAGEVYFVPTGAEGAFPMHWEDGSLAIARVKQGGVEHFDYVSGDQRTVQRHNQRLEIDPSAGVIGELGFGTQELPFSGRDIQDEKILGTFHVATGRNDHLGGSVSPAAFHDKHNATHDDILFAPHKTPNIFSSVRMRRKGESVVIVENYRPSMSLQNFL